MIVVSSKDELERIVKRNSIVVVEYYASWIPESRYFTSVMEELEKHASPDVRIVRVDLEKVELDEELKDIVPPYVRVYVNGEVVFEQEGCFMDVSKDVLVLRRGIRDVLRKLGYRFKV